MLDFFSAVARNAINEATNLISNFFPQIRDWMESGAVNIALLTLALIVGGAVIIDKGTRDNLQKLLDLIIRSLKPIIDQFVNWLGKSIQSLVEYAKILLPHLVAIILYLFKNISTVINHVKASTTSTISTFAYFVKRSSNYSLSVKVL